MREAAIYCRVSSKNQSVEGTSLETQLAACRKLAQEKGYQVQEQHVIQEVYSGLTMDRPYLAKLKDLIDNGEIQAVVIHAGDRFMRDGYDLITLKRYCDKASVELACVTEDLSNELVTYILGWASGQEVAHIKERTERGKKKRLNNGLFMGGNSSKLYGYDYIKDTKEKKNGYREINGETGKVVRDIYNWFLEGDTMTNITVRLHSLGIKSPSGQETWNKVAIYKILSNRAYTGKAEFWGIEINQPELVSLQDFEKVQLKLRRNKQLASRNGKNDYLLSGYIYCANDGRRYIGSVSHKTRYYNCPLGSQKVRLNPCKSKSLNADSIEAIVWLEIERALTDPQVIMAGLEAINDKDYAPELDTLKVRMKHYDKERRMCWRAFELTGDEKTFKQEITQIDSEANQLNKRYAEVEALVKSAEQSPKPSDITAACRTLRSNIGSLTHEDRRKVLEALMIKVHTGETVRIEGVLPCPVPEPQIELTPLRGG